MIALDFDKFNEAGLRSAVKAIEKWGPKVTHIEATNVPKRESGFQVKTATLELESGQKLILKIKAGGGIFQVRLNNKVLAIKNTTDPDKAILEIVDYVQENEKIYQRQKDRLARAKKAKPTNLDTVRTSTGEQIEQAAQTLESLQASNEDLAAQIGPANDSLSLKRDQLATLESELKAEEARNRELRSELKKLEEAA